MCKSFLVLETIKKTKGKGGMSPLQIELANAQAEDVQAMKQELQEVKAEIAGVKNDVVDIKTDVAGIKTQVDLLVKQSESRPLLIVIKELINTRGFWIVLGLIVIGIYGIDLTGLREFIK